MIWGSQRKSKVTKVIKCKWCGEPFEKTAYEGNFKNFKYCSPKCSREYNSAKKKTGATDHSSKISLTRRGKSSSKQNLKVIDIDEENSLLIIKGSVPGKKNSILFISDSIKRN